MCPREIERRIRNDRRKPLDEYVRSILNARSGRDRRSDQQQLIDNAFVNGASERWYLTHKESRHHG